MSTGRAWRVVQVLGLVLGAAGALIVGGGVPRPAQALASHAQVYTNLLLAECDPGGYVPCSQQAASLSVPIADTGLSLTYSSQWAPARAGRPDWTPSTFGLGGWSVNVLQGYDQSQGILVGGDGTWRFAQEVPAGPGEGAVPSYDGNLAYVFNSAGRQVSTVDGHLGTTLLRFAYSPQGGLQQISGTVSGAPVGLTVRRSANGTPTALVGIDGAVTRLSLDRNGDLVALRGPAARTTRFTWQPGGLVTSSTGPGGGVTHFRYGTGGLLVSETDPDGVTQALSRSSTPTRVEVHVTAGLGRTSTYYSALSGRGVRRRYIAAGGATTTEMAQADGSFSLSLPDGTVSTVGAVPSTGWDLSAPVLTPVVTTAPGRPTSRTEVDQHLHEVNGLPYAVTGAVTTTVNGERWVESFDPATRTTAIVDPAGATAATTYDSSGRIITTSVPGSANASFAYNSEGRLVRQTIGAGRLAETTRWDYDAGTGTVTVTRPDHSTITVSVDAAGNPTTIKGPNGAAITETYNGAGLLTELQPPGGARYTLGYSAAGLPTASLAPSLSTGTSIETATYDRDGDLKSLSGLGAKPVTLAYNVAGELTGLSFDQGTATASYSPRTGRLSTAKDPDGVTTSVGFSGALPDKLSWSGPVRGSVSETYDANGRPVSQSIDGRAAIGFSYDGAGNLTTVGPLSLVRGPTTSLVTGSTLGAVETTYRYNDDDWLMGATTTVKGRALMAVSYTRDALGRVTSVAQTGPGGVKTTTEYTYNSADLLARVTVNGRRVETDSYDEAGNRTAVTTPAGRTKAIYNADNELVAWGKASYSWAADGNLARVTNAAGTTSYTFDELGRLRHVRLSDGEPITYLVDAQGQRVGREVDGRLVAGYLYDPSGEVVASTNGAGAVVARYGYDQLGHLAVVEKGGTSYDVVTDPNGSPLLVVNSKSGAIADAITYSAWGQVIKQTAPGIIPFGFDGGLVDPATGLVHFGARDYDPATGRWTGPDPVGFAGGDADLYRYAGDDPVDASDPSGESPGGCAAGFLAGLAGGPLGSLLGLGAGCYASWGSSPPASAPPGPPPAGPSTRAPQSSCTGRYCFGDGGAYICWEGTCGIGPNGFFCKAAHCLGFSGPDANGYQVECFDCSYGDTHLTTGGGLHYNFQAAGEFTAIESSDGSVDVQVRQQPVKGETWVTFATALAANVDGDRVGVYALEPWFLRVNGTVVSATQFSERLRHGGTVARNGDNVTVRWPDGSELAVARNGDIYVGETRATTDSNLSYDFMPGPGLAPALTGILGTASTTSQLVDSDGTTLSLSDPHFEKKLYSQFADSWRINQGASLFDYGPGESTATFTDLRIPYTNYTVASLPASARAEALAICAALGIRTEPLLDDCVLDVGVTGDPGLAAAEAQVAATGPTTTPSPSGGASFGEATNVSLAGHSGTVLYGVSCPSGPSCVAVGQDKGNYNGANGTIVVSETATGWRSAPVPVPVAPPVHGADSLSSVSCRLPGSCTAVGAYQGSNKSTLPLVETGTGSDWRPAAVVALPAGANGSGALGAVSCTKAGTCLAVGTYGNLFDYHQMGVLSTGGQWGEAQAVEIELPPGGAATDPGLDAVSCAGTSCLAVGQYNQSFYVKPGMAVAESGGRFQRAVEIKPPASNPTFIVTTLSGVSCTGPATCSISGTYLNPKSEFNQAMVASEIDGAWQPSVPVELPANAAATGVGALNGIWCGVTGGAVPNCVAVGFYADNAGVTRPMYADRTNGHWAQAVEVALPAGDGGGSLDGVSCSPGGVCAAVGAAHNGDGIVTLSRAATP
jgi:RHS repeat-associated protein